jgi:hypothetical protein
MKIKKYLTNDIWIRRIHIGSKKGQDFPGGQLPETNYLFVIQELVERHTSSEV